MPSKKVNKKAPAKKQSTAERIAKKPVRFDPGSTELEKRLDLIELTIVSIEDALQSLTDDVESINDQTQEDIGSLEKTYNDFDNRLCDVEADIIDIQTTYDADDALARAKCCEDKNDECPCGLVGCTLVADFDELDDDLPEVEDLGDEISMQLNHLAETCYEDAYDNGWWDAYDNKGNAERLGEKLLMIHSEVTEAVECLRDCEDAYVLIETDACDHISGKPVGFAIELADILIRTLDICGYLGIDIEKAVKTKLEYNRTRGYRHGNKNL